jgi:hypothetical protein
MTEYIYSVSKHRKDTFEYVLLLSCDGTSLWLENTDVPNQACSPAFATVALDHAFLLTGLFSVLCMTYPVHYTVFW